MNYFREARARSDKKIKLELKAFADTLKLNTPMPTDLVGIIAKYEGTGGTGKKTEPIRTPREIKQAREIRQQAREIQSQTPKSSLPDGQELQYAEDPHIQQETRYAEDPFASQLETVSQLAQGRLAGSHDTRSYASVVRAVEGRATSIVEPTGYSAPPTTPVGSYHPRDPIETEMNQQLTRLIEERKLGTQRHSNQNGLQGVPRNLVAHIQETNDMVYYYDTAQLPADSTSPGHEADFEHLTPRNLVMREVDGVVYFYDAEHHPAGSNLYFPAHTAGFQRPVPKNLRAQEVNGVVFYQPPYPSTGTTSPGRAFYVQPSPPSVVESEPEPRLPAYGEAPLTARSVAREPHPQPFTRSVFETGSSAGTLTNTLKSRTSAGRQSTVPTSIFDAESSRGPPKVSLQERFVERTNLLAIHEDSEQVVMEEADRDGQSSISSVTILDPKQRRDIIKKFIEAILKDLPSAPSVSHDFTQSKIPFQQRFQVLLKNYSEQVKKDAGQRTRRQAAKQIRLLRREISEKFEEVFRGSGPNSKEQRVYPRIIEQAKKFTPPEKQWAEKVRDWTKLLWKETPSPERLLDEQPYELQLQYQSAVLDIVHATPASHPVSLSDFDHAASSSESEIGEVVHTTPGEDKEIYNFLTSHHAFQELVTDLQHLVERHYSNQLETIRQRVSLGLRRPTNARKSEPGRHAAMFYLDWDILTFLQEQYPLGLAQDLGSVLTITGQATDAYMATVREYLNGTWPSYPSTLLDALQGAIVNYPQEETSGSLLFSAPESGIIVNLLEKSLLVTGSEDFIVMVAQQIAWLVSACRASSLGLGYSHVSFREDASRFLLPLRTFHISSEVLPLTSEDPGSCWNEVVGSSTIVTGFPIPERHNNEKGLELPLEVMAGLGGVPLATQFDGGYLLKARSIAFAPVERNGDSVQWHFLNKGGGRMRYADIADLCPTRLPVEVLDQEDLTSTRAFLGWCSDSTNNLGTVFIPYKNIGFSNTNTPPKRVVALTGVSVGFAHVGTGQATFTIGRQNGSYTADKPTYYLETLDNAKQIHVILHDMEQRRAWHTDGERAILHTILHRQAMGAYVTKGKSVELQYADLMSPSSVRAAMESNANVVVMHDHHMDKREVDTKLFKDLVGDLYARLEGLEANAEKLALAGVQLKLDWKKRAQGYEYMDLVQSKHKMLIKEAELKKTCGQWPEFARDISAVVLFGIKFGDVFLPNDPSRLCPGFSMVPTGKDYLTVEVSALQRLYTENGSQQTQQQITAAGTRWHRSNHLFEPCPQSKAPNNGLCKCERIQELVPRSMVTRVRVPGRLGQSGAVIFGHGSSPWRKDIGSSWRLNARNSRGRQDIKSSPRLEESITYSTSLTPDLVNTSTPWRLKGEEDSSLLSKSNAPSMKPLVLARPTPHLSTSRPPLLTSRHTSFHSSEKTNSSTGRSSNATNTDLEFMTPATSYHAGSGDEQEASFSTINEHLIRQRASSMVIAKDEHQISKSSNPYAGPFGRGNHERMLYSHVAKAEVPTSSTVAISRIGPSQSSSIRKDYVPNAQAWIPHDPPSRNSGMDTERPRPKQIPYTRSSSALSALSNQSSSAFGSSRPPRLRRVPAFQADITSCGDAAKT
ncbi:uncharacterized protein PAC_15622 [Phialocephala subalpina]|uniref:Uncharacterized protein n=1 Tax=Phialocephala subalpina TaxID=576137 RepID=A0A1L7XL10_9HELO|nr:uncharacterized protein PAC_15622 [Phialocephala subalpina]